VADEIVTRASAQSIVIAGSISQTASQKAIPLAGTGLAYEEVASRVREHLEGLSDSYLQDQLGGVLIFASPPVWSCTSCPLALGLAGDAGQDGGRGPTRWATPDQLASRLDLPDAVKTLHLSMVASVDIAYVLRDTAADHPGLTAPPRIIGMRAQGEAEIAIEQGETRYEGVTWTTRSQIAANQLIPLPQPARRGLINLADDVIATTNHAVAAAAQLHPSDSVQRTKPPEPTAGRPREIHGSISRFEPPGGPRR
jgi:hypothetical protein